MCGVVGATAIQMNGNRGVPGGVRQPAGFSLVRGLIRQPVPKRLARRRLTTVRDVE